jgi:hypothetical protein
MMINARNRHLAPLHDPAEVAEASEIGDVEHDDRVRTLDGPHRVP